MIAILYRWLTDRPWTTVRSCAAEFGPPPGARYAEELAAYTDTELLLYGEAILAVRRARGHRQARATGTDVRGRPARRRQAGADGLVTFEADDRGHRSRSGAQKEGPRPSTRHSRSGGRYWDRTSDLFGVNEALSR